MRNSSKALVVAIGLSAALSLAACANTIRGAGKDIAAAADATGDAIEDIAN